MKIFEFLKWVIYDLKHPKKDRPYGITCYVGLPGTGKTLSMSEKLLQLKQRFPKAVFYTNFAWIHEDGQITSWRDLKNINNGEDGVIFAIDEVQDIFGRKDWVKMPKYILSLFAQNRKHAKMFVCTSQAYADIVIDLRRRCHWIIECSNLWGRWVFQRYYKNQDYIAIENKDNEYRLGKCRHKYDFIASNSIYDSYDTYKIIDTIEEN